MHEGLSTRGRSLISLATCFLLLAVALLAVGYYRAQTDGGYPLDDSWIHLTFARNLAGGVGFGANPHQSTPGATSPLWVFLLAGGFFLGADHTVWPWLLDALVLGVAGILGAWLVRSLSYDARDAGNPESHFLSLQSGLCGLAVAWSAPLIWSAAGAMEVPAFTALTFAALLAFSRAQQSKRRTALLWGSLAGLAALARPEGLLLVVLLPAVELVYGQRAGLRRAIVGLAAGAALYSPSIVFCLATAGRPFPNTFYAKTTALLAGAPELSFIARVLWFFYLNTPATLLLFLAGAVTVICFAVGRRLPKGVLAAAGFVVALPLAYACMGRTSLFGVLAGNFGRYLYPVIGPALVVGFWAVGQWAHLISRMWARGLAVALSTAVVLVSVIGAPEHAAFYAHNVNDINTMQVRMAELLKERLPPGVLVAANDVGALAYFTDFRVLDLVGLVSSDVLEALRSAGPHPDQRELALLRVLSVRRPECLVVFPRWFERLVEALRPGLHTLAVRDNPRNITSGGNTLVAYEINWRRLEEIPQLRPGQ